MEEFTVSNEQMKEMIRRFDEVLSEKASKTAIHEVQFWIEQNFVKNKNWGLLEEQVNKAVEKQGLAVKGMKDAVQMFEANMSEEITSAVKKSLQKSMANYEKVLTQFAKFFD